MRRPVNIQPDGRWVSAVRNHAGQVVRVRFGVLHDDPQALAHAAHYRLRELAGRPLKAKFYRLDPNREAYAFRRADAAWAKLDEAWAHFLEEE